MTTTSTRVEDARLQSFLERKPVGNALLRTTELQAIVSELLALRSAAQEASFLASRLNELEWSDLDDTYRDFYGHVAPSLERLLMHVRSLSQGAGHEQ